MKLMKKDMIKFKSLLWIVFLSVLIAGCEKEQVLYERPEWLQGKIYTQIQEEPDLSTFAHCIELTGYDQIINISGSYTVFAPSNDAWNAYLSANGYSSVDDIPIARLTEMVKYHIVQNPWSKRQLQSLDVFGWIDTLDITNDKPRGFKRETLLLDKNRKFGLAMSGSAKPRTMIVDTLASGFHRRVITDSRKFVPVFFQQFFDIYNLNKNDYEFYFNRSFEGSNNLYYANAKILSDEISAENGFIYIVDQVVEPLKTAYDILENNNNGNQYTNFLSLLNRYPQFDYNHQETIKQPGADQGIAVDSLFDLTYPELLFDINNEKTSAPRGTYGLPQNVTIRYHHGLMAPTNEAFQRFIDNYLRIPQGWQTLDNAPAHITRLIARSYMSYNQIYPTDFIKGFINGEDDIIKLDEDHIIEKQFGSNATFIGLNEAIIPRAFSSVTGPIYLQQGYSKFMYAIERSGLLPALKRENMDYSLFVESDQKSSLDSSFFYDSGRQRFEAIELTGGGFFTRVVLSTADLRNLVLNHVATRTPRGIARKEFIPNLGGNYLIFNNETGEVSGTAATTIGFRGSISQPNYPRELNFSSDNGSTYEIDNWFSFTTSDIYSQILALYPEFNDLMVQAGLALPKEFRYTFVSNNESYTVFVPTKEAIESADLASLTKEELRNLLLLHFVRGKIIFTDGSASPGYYTTERIDESSTAYSIINTQMYIEPGIDIIKLRGKDGGSNVDILESPVANRLAGVREPENSSTPPAFPIMFNNAVIHEIDRVLKVEELDTK
ncbi:MAG: fasciclin domain-containing protein [Mariniphaga sp.]|nr:fasciclin domain-containing protein [Mariniphaga sp.]